MQIHMVNQQKIKH